MSFYKRHIKEVFPGFLALVLLSSCLNSSESKPQVKKEPVAVTPIGASSKVDDKKTPKTEKSASKSCKVDAECDSYFRCIDAKCTNPPAISGITTKTTPTAVLKKADGSSETFNLELAISMQEMMRGLMFRKTMRDDWGMLFIYDDVRPRSFWMKNTLIPLDMLFINEKGIVVGIVEGAEPMTLQARGVNEPAKYVLELNAGRTRTLGINAGDSMALTHVEAWQNIEK